MTTPHPLDHPLWHSLTARHAALAIGEGPARRLRGDISILSALADHGDAAVATMLALTPPGAQFGLLEAAPPPAMPGTAIVLQAEIDQMVLETPPAPGGPQVDHLPLGEAETAEMLALAELTRPGPFLSGTHRLGRFIGVRRDGALVAMAGERMKLPGWQEVSAICTHPDWRGHGFAEALMRPLIARMIAEGDGVFLHCFPGNPAARLYEKLGFRRRRGMIYTIFERVNR